MLSLCTPIEGILLCSVSTVIENTANANMKRSSFKFSARLRIRGIRKTPQQIFAVNKRGLTVGIETTNSSSIVLLCSELFIKTLLHRAESIR